MYNNPYFNRPSVDSINAQINELEKMKAQVQQINPMQQPSINQTFQLTPNNSNAMKYATSIEEVNKELVFSDTPFFSKDMSIMWLKNAKGDVKSYEIKEIVQKDEKDMLIDALMLQIEEMKKERDKNEQSVNKYVNDTTQIKKSSNGKSNSRVDKK